MCVSPQLKSFHLIIFRWRFIGLKIFKCTCFSWIISSVNMLPVFLTHCASVNSPTCDCITRNSVILDIKLCIPNQSKLRDWATGELHNPAQQYTLLSKQERGKTTKVIPPPYLLKLSWFGGGPTGPSFTPKIRLLHA